MIQIGECTFDPADVVRMTFENGRATVALRAQALTFEGPGALEAFQRAGRAYGAWLREKWQREGHPDTHVSQGPHGEGGPRLIPVGFGRLINPAHITLVEPLPGGGARVHLALAQADAAGRPGHVAIELDASAAAALWGTLHEG